MKRLVAISVVLTLAGGLVFAELMGWPEKKAPRLALPEAYSCAATALGSATNQYHCLRANWQNSRSPNGEWLFTFCSTNGSYKSVFVFFDKKTQVQNGRMIYP